MIKLKKLSLLTVLTSQMQGLFNQGHSWLSNHMMVANYGVAKSPYMLKLQENNAKAG